MRSDEERMAEAVFQQRTRLGLTQRELAERAGISRHTVVNIEGGRTGGIRMDTLSKVLGSLGLELRAMPKVALPQPVDEDAVAARERFRRRFQAGGDYFAMLAARSR